MWKNKNPPKKASKGSFWDRNQDLIIYGGGGLVVAGLIGFGIWYYLTNFQSDIRIY
jgi:hypothetical protein